MDPRYGAQYARLYREHGWWRAREEYLTRLNPLVDSPGYEPTALGMSLARPFVTILASVNDPAGLLRLARSMRLR